MTTCSATTVKCYVVWQKDGEDPVVGVYTDKDEALKKTTSHNVDFVSEDNEQICSINCGDDDNEGKTFCTELSLASCETTVVHVVIYEEHGEGMSHHHELRLTLFVTREKALDTAIDYFDVNHHQPDGKEDKREKRREKVLSDLERDSGAEFHATGRGAGMISIFDAEVNKTYVNFDDEERKMIPLYVLWINNSSDPIVGIYRDKETALKSTTSHSVDSVSKDWMICEFCAYDHEHKGKVFCTEISASKQDLEEVNDELYLMIYNEDGGGQSYSNEIYLSWFYSKDEAIGTAEGYFDQEHGNGYECNDFEDSEKKSVQQESGDDEDEIKNEHCDKCKQKMIKELEIDSETCFGISQGEATVKIFPITINKTYFTDEEDEGEE